jgi:predicted phage terminase large subunit-like protein
VFFPEKAPWLEDLENELLAFPGRHDDQVDALIQGLAWQREGFGIQQSGRTYVMY